MSCPPSSYLPEIAWLLSARLENALKGNGPFLAHLPFWGPKWSNLPEFLLLCCRRPLLRGNVPFRDFCYCAVDQANGRRPKAFTNTPGSWKTLGNGPAKVRKRSEMVWERPENLQKRFGRGRKTLRNPGLQDQKWSGKLARKRSGQGLKTFRNGLGKAKKRSVTV